MLTQRAGLDHWCARYREIYDELRRSRQRVRLTATEQERERRLRDALERLERDQRYYPLSYLAQVGFLPRYGFPGSTVAVRDPQEREIIQGAAVGIVEFAPGNIVYVAGRKLRVDRTLFPRGSRLDPRQNADTYRYCPRCDFVSTRDMDQECVHCHDTLSVGRSIDYSAARGSEVESISQEDEYRDRESYDLAYHLTPDFGAPSPGAMTVDADGWKIRYSRLREVAIYNRGRRASGGAVESFLVCLECGMWHERPAPADGEDEGRRPAASGHLPSCTVSTWDASRDERLERALHLRAAFQGDVVQIALGGPVASDERWVVTFDQALRLALQLELFIGPKEVGSFTRTWMEGGAERKELVFYDTMPGGTGYLRRLVEDLPRITARAVDHLSACPCESACYRCLKEFWNQRNHDQLDKRLVISALRTIAATAGAPTRATPADVRFESFLEARFYDLLRQAGLPLPKTQVLVRSADGRFIVRADFRYDQPPLVILTDGRAFHAASELQILQDLDQRNELEFAGRRLLEFSYEDVTGSPEAVIETIQQALAIVPRDNTIELDERESDRLDPIARAFVEKLVAADHRLRMLAGVTVNRRRVGNVLAVHGATRRLLIAVDPTHWIGTREAWVESLRCHNALRLAGWRVVRVPTPWFDAPQGERLIRRVATMS